MLPPGVTSRVLLPALTLLFLHALGAQGQRSDLRFEPSAPAAGATASVYYAPAPVFAGQPVLALRAELVSPNSSDREPWRRRVVLLRLGPDGKYHGQMRLPDSVAYAVFVVEDTAGSRIDGNANTGWPLVLTAPDGRPLPGGLRIASLRRDDAHCAAANEMVRLYPDRARSWQTLLFCEIYRRSPAERFTGLEKHRTELQRLHDRLSAVRNLSADEEAAMWEYAHAQVDSAKAAYWAERAAREHPREPVVARLEIYRTRDRYRDDPRGGLAHSEHVWSVARAADIDQVIYSFEYAKQAKDPEALLRWADRYVALVPSNTESIAATLLATPELSGAGARLLRSRLSALALAPDSVRNLFNSRAVAAASRAAQARRIYAMLGTLAVREGRLRAGLDTLQMAAADWDNGVLRTVAGAYLSLGDTARAASTWARVAADPATPAPFADTVRSRLGLSQERWDSAVDSARTHLRDAVLAHAVSRPIPEIRVQTAAGDTVALSSWIAGAPAVLVAWSRLCGYAVAALPAIHALHHRLSPAGVKVLLLDVDEPPSDGIATWLSEHQVSLQVVYDSWGEASRQIGHGGTPEYYVVDGALRLRFIDEGSLSEVPRQVAALLAGAGLPPAMLH